MQAVYRLTERDLYQARSSHAGISNRLIQIFGALLVLYGVIGLVAAPRGQTVLPVVIGLVLVFRLRLANVLSFSRDAASKAESQLSASEAGLDLRSQTGSWHFGWDGFVRYAETKDLFLLYTQPNVFHLVPKRAFAAAGELDVFRNLLQSNLGERTASYKHHHHPKTAAFIAVLAIAVTIVVWLVSHHAH